MDEAESVPAARETRRAHELALLIDGVRDYAILLLDARGIITTWNAGAERLKGYTAQEALGQPSAIFYTAEDRAREHPGEGLGIATREGRFEEEGWRVRKDGTPFWASVVLTAIRDDAGELLGFAKVTRDLSERRRAEQALRDANEQLLRSNTELERFASVAAHDLQEPLRTVAGFSGLLLRRHSEALDEGGRGYVDHIVAAVERMQQLVDDLLGYARAAEPVGVGRGGAAVVLDTAIGLVLSELNAAIGAREAVLVVDVEESILVHAAPRDVEAVLRNLMSNAIKFAHAEHPHITVRATPAETTVRIDVIDNGIGIDPADRPRLFLPFQRLNSAADYRGTGLGLAIAQRVVERNGGAIGVDSVAGEGSRFWFTLPAG
jgi:PAS domain S-box-containing protein